MKSTSSIFNHHYIFSKYTLKQAVFFIKMCTLTIIPYYYRLTFFQVGISIFQNSLCIFANYTVFEKV